MAVAVAKFVSVSSEAFGVSRVAGGRRSERTSGALSEFTSENKRDNNAGNIHTEGTLPCAVSLIVGCCATFLQRSRRLVS